MVRPDRALTSALSYVLTIGITTLLITGLTIGAANMLEDQQQEATREELETIGNRLASEFARVDALAQQGGTATVSVSQPSRVTGDRYSISLLHGASVCSGGRLAASVDTCLRLTSIDSEISIRVPIRNESKVSMTTADEGTFQLRADASKTTVGGEVASQDLSSRIGVGEEVSRDTLSLVGGVGNRPPVASFDFEPASPWSRQSVTFNASDSFDPDGSVTEYRWDWDGDGAVDQVTTTPTATHTFSNGGGYNVTLTVEDDESANTPRSQFIDVSGLEYNRDMTAVGSDDATIAFSITNNVGKQIEITHVFVDPADDTIDSIEGGDEIDIDADDQDGELDDSFDVYDSGRIVELDDTAKLSDGSTATIEIGNFEDSTAVNMNGKRVRVGLKYNIGDRTNSTRFEDVVGSASIVSYDLTASGQDVDLTFESTKQLDDITVELGGDGSGTLTEGDFSESGPGPYTYTADVSTGTDGIFKANLTDAETPGGTILTGTPYNDTTSVSSGPYTWTTPADWDGESHSTGIAHADIGSRSETELQLGYGRTDNGGSSLVAYYPFENTAVATDQSAHGDDNTGAVQGSPGTNIGLFGTDAYDLDGANDYAVVPASESLEMSDTDEVTVSAWVNKDTPQGGWIAIFQHSDTSYNLQFASGMYPTFTVHDGGYTIATATNDISDGDWYHLVGVFDGDDTEIYVDGNLAATKDSADEIDSASSPAGIGENVDQSGRHLDGQLDELRVYNRSLSPDEVRNLTETATEGEYRSGWKTGPSISGNDVNLRYNVDQASGQTVEVVVVADYGTPGPGIKRSNIITLSGASGEVDVTGLPGQPANRYSLIVRLDSSTTTDSPTVQGLELVEDT